jgi:hypothetical protein
MSLLDFKDSLLLLYFNPQSTISINFSKKTQFYENMLIIIRGFTGGLTGV